MARKKATRRRHDEATKAAVLERMRQRPQTGETIAAIAEDEGIAASVISRWWGQRPPEPRKKATGVAVDPDEALGVGKGVATPGARSLLRMPGVVSLEMSVLDAYIDSRLDSRVEEAVKRALAKAFGGGVG